MKFRPMFTLSPESVELLRFLQSERNYFRRLVRETSEDWSVKASEREALSVRAEEADLLLRRILGDITS